MACIPGFHGGDIASHGAGPVSLHTTAQNADLVMCWYVWVFSLHGGYMLYMMVCSRCQLHINQGMVRRPAEGVLHAAVKHMQEELPLASSRNIGNSVWACCELRRCPAVSSLSGDSRVHAPIAVCTQGCEC